MTDIPVDPASEWIHVTHPDIPLDPEQEPGYVTRAALDEVWAEKGWVETEWSPPPEPEADAQAMTTEAPTEGEAV